MKYYSWHKMEHVRKDYDKKGRTLYSQKRVSLYVAFKIEMRLYPSLPLNNRVNNFLGKYCTKSIIIALSRNVFN